MLRTFKGRQKASAPHKETGLPVQVLNEKRSAFSRTVFIEKQRYYHRCPRLLYYSFSFIQYGMGD
jgi:hypothetical protein